MKSQSSDISRSILTRRDFIAKVGNAAAGVALVGGAIEACRFLWPNVVYELPTRFRAGSIEDFAPGTVVFSAKQRVLIFRDPSGYFYAVSAVCTHLGCTANWKPEGTPDHPDGVIACPCHGSVFDRKGHVVHGPAPRPLDKYRMVLDEGSLYVDKRDTVDDDNMIMKV